jgi:hypothetical protein
MLQNVFMVVDDGLQVKSACVIGWRDVAWGLQVGCALLASSARQREPRSCDTFQPIEEPVK